MTDLDPILPEDPPPIMFGGPTRVHIEVREDGDGWCWRIVAFPVVETGRGLPSRQAAIDAARLEVERLDSSAWEQVETITVHPQP